MILHVNASSSVSTHSRLKAAGPCPWADEEVGQVSTHSRLKAAGLFCFGFSFFFEVSTHSRLKAAGQAV